MDGAFGASILLSSNERKRLDGIEYSDSLSWDAHKWLRQTYGCSMVLVRDQSHLVRSFAVHPEYLTDAGAFNEAPDFWHVPQGPGTDPPRPQPEAVDHPPGHGQRGYGDRCIDLRGCADGPG